MHNPHILFEKLWFDVHLIELRIEVSDGESKFANKVYVGHEHLQEVLRELENFKKQIHHGTYDIAFGEFGIEYANGAFRARLHFHLPGKLHISTQQQSDYFEFSKNKVASEARMYLKSEPGLLDDFILELSALSAGNSSKACFECVQH